MKEIIIGGMKVTVTKKKIKNMYLRVRPNGDVEVSAPYKMPEQSIVLFVNTKQAWIERSIEKALSRSASKREYSDGEKLFLFGREMTLRFDNGKNKGYYIKEDEVFLCVGEAGTVEERKELVDRIFRDLLNDKLKEAVKYCENMTGLSANEWRIKNMKTRWGSCNVKDKRIWLSLKLAEKPYECLLYVICHELAHLKVKGHGKDFYSLLDSFYPDRKRVEKILKMSGNEN